MTKPFSLAKSSTPDTRAYLDIIGEKHRKQFGQFFTHPDVADFMVRWVLGSGHTALYDPSFGLGAFHTPARQGRHVDFSASEIDPSVLSFWKRSTGCNTPFVEREDYLLSWGKRHTNIVCNPPYMRFQRFLNREAVFRAFSQNAGLRLSGYTNTASAFLLKSLSELDGHGRLAYIMPLEFLNTGYGKVVKTKLLEGLHLSAIIRLDCEKELFPDATTSVGIILYDAAVCHQTVDFYSVDSISSLQTVLKHPPTARVPLSELSPDVKWMQYYAEGDCSVNTGSLISLNHYGRFSRGIATGANKFFVLRPSDAAVAGLDDSECIPCLTRSSQVKQSIFSSTDYDRLVQNNAPVLLFSANPHHSQAAEKYIRFGESNDYHRRFLTKSRTPWYKTEIRTPAPLLIGVFSRGGYKVVRNQSAAVNLSCFHGFYPNVFGHRYLDSLFLYLASRPGRTVVGLSMRKYGDELDKFEPNDLNAALVPDPSTLDKLSPESVQRAVECVANNGSVPHWIDASFEALLNA